MKIYLTACVLLASMLCSCSKGTTIETTTTSAAHHHEIYFRFTIVDNTVCNENICGYYFNEGEDSWSAGWSNTEVESITEEEYNEIYASEVEFDTENIVDIYWFSNVTQEDINLSYCTFADSVG